MTKSTKMGIVEMMSLTLAKLNKNKNMLSDNFVGKNVNRCEWSNGTAMILPENMGLMETAAEC